MSLLEFSGNSELGERTQSLADRLLLGPVGHISKSGRPFAAEFGIWGVGLYASKNTFMIVVLVDVSRGIEPNKLVPALEVDVVKEVFQIVFGGDLEKWTDVQALGIRTPELHVLTGEPITAARTGTLGAPVTWGNQRRGLLTVGHVAGQVNQTVQSRGLLRIFGTTVGTVVASFDPVTSQTGADVAVVELLPSVYFTGPPFSGATTLVGQANISILKHAGPINASVIAMASWFHFPKSNGTYGDVYLTSQAVTQAGDSGTAATDPVTNAVAGHVVGASPNCASVIQDINYQLGVIRALPGFGGISV